jgi:sugar (pentulose or hexulose) kinase
LGPLLPNLAAETGANGLQVIIPGEHDTGSAVVGLPAEEAEPVFLSSGTWSLMGRELDRPVISQASQAANFSNEGGVFGTTRFLKNIAGLWLLQECKRLWDASGNTIGYDELVAGAARAPAFAALIDPDAVEFQAPPNMIEAITTACGKTGQFAPSEPGAITRVILESLALKYRRTKDLLAQVTAKPVSTIHIVGGGSQNRLLNQFAANATGCRIVAGPVEATSIGNMVMQLYALGKIKSLAEGRALTRKSFTTIAYEPQHPAVWDNVYTRFQTLYPPV